MKKPTTILILLITFLCSCVNHDEDHVKEVEEFEESSSNQTEENVSQNEDNPIVFSSQENGVQMEELSDFFNLNDIHEMNEYIDKEMGVTILYSIGVNPIYVQLDSLSENKDYYDDNHIEYWIADQILRNLQNKQIKDFVSVTEPVFECENIMKYGAFIDNGASLNVMSQSIAGLLEISDVENYSEKYIASLNEDLKKYKKMENNSLRVVLTKKNENRNPRTTQVAIFHFTKKKW
ncbi:MAG: hypothetical protein JKY54_17575 [Flavobacteriales bacterium]|nr:hypothetical protein [Flavobacteriales bacterium]